MIEHFKLKILRKQVDDKTIKSELTIISFLKHSFTANLHKNTLPFLDLKQQRVFYFK